VSARHEPTCPEEAGPTGPAFAGLRHQSNTTRAYLALLDGHDAFVTDTGLAGRTRRARVVAVSEGTGPYDAQARVTIQWTDTRGVEQLLAQRFNATRYRVETYR
jgi:hypothetical protein